MTRLRISNHKLRIETGRHKNIPREERICQKCSLGKIEDEKHYLLECTKFVVQRKEHLEKFTKGLNDNQVFINCMKLKSKNVINAVADFISSSQIST